jgi:hypothetical protein
VVLEEQEVGVLGVLFLVEETHLIRLELPELQILEVVEGEDLVLMALQQNLEELGGQAS